MSLTSDDYMQQPQMLYDKDGKAIFPDEWLPKIPNGEDQQR